jgi:hypothetical protein
MATVALFPIATTAAPRISASVNYSGSGTALFQVLSSTWNTDSPTIAVTFEVQHSFDSGATWQDMCATLWHPGEFGKGGALPAMACTAEDVLGSRLLRAVLSASASIQVGIQATV